ncbi:conserved hypothetical protein [Ricinus communis]|uniref:Uncharacterized protein n=1 Tax=Ricinus communis TaxID=3988 RepID=B9RXX6_RICCO|nr:conserved hypothetical protein [Ricinus communis]
MARISRADQIQDNTTRVFWGHDNRDYNRREEQWVSSKRYFLELMRHVKGKDIYWNPLHQAILFIRILIDYVLMLQTIQVWDLWTEGRALEIVDLLLEGSYAPHEALRGVQIGLFEAALPIPKRLAATPAH